MAEKNDNQLEIKKVNNISREIKPATERMLWGVSAGICEFNGCTNKLYSHHVTKEKVNLSESAHIRFQCRRKEAFSSAFYSQN